MAQSKPSNRRIALSKRIWSDPFSLTAQILAVKIQADTLKVSHTTQDGRWTDRSEQLLHGSLTAAVVTLETQATKDRTCVYCGCTDSKACQGGCSWLIQFPVGNVGVCTSPKCINQFGEASINAAHNALGIALAHKAKTAPTALHALSGRKVTSK